MIIKSHNIINKSYILILVLLSLVLLFCGCSGDSSPEKAITEASTAISNNTESIPDVSEASPTTEVLPAINPMVVIPNELSSTDEIFWKAAPDLYACAYNYCKDVSTANLLFCQYYRSSRDKFTTNQWNILSGSIDTEFVSSVEAYYPEDADITSLNSLTGQAVLFEPVLGERIELSHFFASLNLLVKKRQINLNNDNNTKVHPVFDLATWAGDCYELTNDILASDSTNMSDEELSTYIYNLLGKTEGHFNRDNLLADIDTYNIACSIEHDNENLMSKIAEYYSCILTGASRFELFKANRFGQTATEDDIAASVYKALTSTDNIYMPLLRESLDVDIKNDEHLRILNAISVQFSKCILSED